MASHVLKKSWTNSALYMDTIVSLKVVTARPEAEVQDSMTRAFSAFRFVETVCSRFQAQSEVRRLSLRGGEEVQVSDLLFEAIRFAWQVADLTDGLFDPTIGQTLEQYGFNRHYLTGEKVGNDFAANEAVSYKDVVLDEEKRTVTLQKPLVLDLGAVAKGLAVDLAVREMRHFEGYVVDAGGDLFVGGLNERDELWRVGIRHPMRQEETICTLQLTDVAVCTSGSYERRSPVKEQMHHLIDPRTGESLADLLSCTVLAPFAMMADAFSTAAFLLGPVKGMEWLAANEVEGLWIPSSLELHMTKEMKRYLV